SAGARQPGGPGPEERRSSQQSKHEFVSSAHVRAPPGRPVPFPWSAWKGASAMSDPVTDLVKAHLKQLRLPAMARELERLSREAAASNQNYEQFLLQLAEAELAARATNALDKRIKDAAFPVAKDFDTYDFSAMPSLSRPKLLELALCEW